MKSKIYLSLLLSVIIFNGCKKEGPQGPAGKDGNANVKSNTITFSTWNWDGTYGYEYADFTWSEVTSSIVNSGALNIYLSTPAGWAPLPRTIYPTSTRSQSQRYVYSVSSFKIIVQDSDLLPPSPSLGTWTIKAVAIDASARMQNPDLDWSNYNAVKERFNLKD